ncbi:MAG: PAS domain S-box protein, partial [Gammaproteobacteria bacterium]|nr:PAS domain S-box protein [Gammaproteobacteria bacterium]
AGREEFTHEPYRIATQDGAVKWVEDITQIRRAADGSITHYQGIVFDITDKVEADAEIKRSLREKEVLLREIHHRVKNNMAVVSSLMSLQARFVDDKRYTDMFREGQNRIRAMALVHEQLYRTEDFGSINVRAYVDSLVRNVQSAHTMDVNVPVRTDVDSIHLEIDNLVPLGLIMNELLSNAFKYAFTGIEKPDLSLQLKKTGDHNIILTISDNGNGLPEGFDINTSKGLGLQLVSMLTTQIRGRLEVSSDKGATFRITFPEKLEYARHLSQSAEDIHSKDI